MRKYIYWNKLYIKKEDGVLARAIIGLGKYPYERKIWKNKEVGFSTQRFGYVSKYKYTLIINIWIAEIWFEWIGKEQEPTDKEKAGYM